VETKDSPYAGQAVRGCVVADMHNHALQQGKTCLVTGDTAGIGNEKLV